ncbi:MAG: zinc-binding dehydrogenase [Candidatus Xenobia bacterium]
MKAVVIEEHGGREKLQVKTIADPECGPQDVLVRVRACGLNHLDILAREGRVPVQIRMPHILGCEVAGDIAKVGSHVEGLKEGQRVAVLTRLSCGRCEHCLAGEDNICIKAQAIGLGAHGGYAELVRLPATNAIPLPEGVSYEDAAGSVMSMLTAWHMLLGRAHLKPGETLLVLAAGSGIGSAAVQVGKLTGARVIATAGSAEKLTRALELGADAGINYNDQDMVAEVKRLTGKRGVDVVFEHVGAATFEQSVESLTRNGRLVTCGAHTGGKTTLDIWKLFAKQISLIGSYLGTRRELHDLLQVMSRGQLRPVIFERLPLERAAEGHRLLEERAQFGKILLQVS